MEAEKDIIALLVRALKDVHLLTDHHHHHLVIIQQREVLRVEAILLVLLDNTEKNPLLIIDPHPITEMVRNTEAAVEAEVDTQAAQLVVLVAIVPAAKMPHHQEVPPPPILLHTRYLNIL